MGSLRVGPSFGLSVESWKDRVDPRHAGSVDVEGSLLTSGTAASHFGRQVHRGTSIVRIMVAMIIISMITATVIMVIVMMIGNHMNNEGSSNFESCPKSSPGLATVEPKLACGKPLISLIWSVFGRGRSMAGASIGLGM